MTIETERTLHVDGVLSDNWSRFHQWKEEGVMHQTLEIPEDIGRVFIPRRILEMSERPDQVNSFVGKSDTQLVKD